MRNALFIAVAALFSSTALAQEVPFSQYVGDGVITNKVYGSGYKACDVTTNVCRLGDGVNPWSARPILGENPGVFYPLDGDTGLFDDNAPDDVTGTWVPTANGFVRIKANATAGSSLTISPPTGTLGPGLAPKILEVTNSTGGDLTITFSGYTEPTDYITAATLANNETREFHIDTDDTGSNWRILTGYLDFTSLPASGTLDGTELAICQKGGAWTQCTAQAIGDLGGPVTDPDAIHVNVPSEISGITQKVTPVGADLLVIEDSADGFNKKRVEIGDLPGGGGGGGESNVSQDVGTGAFSVIGTTPKVGTALQFKTIDEGGGIVIDDTSDVLTISQGARTRVEVTGTSTLTNSQVFQTILTNFGMTAGGDTTLSAYAGSTSLTLMVEVAGQSWSIRPPAGERFALNNTLLDVGDKIDIDTTEIGNSATLLRIKTSATPTYAWYFYIAAGNHTDGGP